MLKWYRGHRRELLAYGIVGGCFALALFAFKLGSQRDPTLLERLRVEVPLLVDLASFDGRGFLRGVEGFHTDGINRGNDLRSSVPHAANGRFRARSGTPAGPGLELTILDAKPVVGQFSGGAVAYERALPGADVVTVADSGKLEILFVVHDVEKFSSPVLATDLGREGDQAELARDGSLFVRAKSGRTVLALSRPVAVDARGTSRQGRYEALDSGLWRASVSLDELVAPIVIDPSVYVPHWTLLQDDSQPGAQVFYEDRGSRQNRIAFDANRGKVMLTRPTRPQQHEDSAALMGRPMSANPGEVRSPGLGSEGKLVTSLEQARWTSTYRQESETWQLNDDRWERVPAVGLPGYLDSTLTHVPGHLFAFAGAGPDQVFSWNISQPAIPPNLYAVDQGMAYEMVGEDWFERRVAGAPPRRVRPAAGRFADEMLVFGGRQLRDYSQVGDEPPPRPGATGRRYPDNATRALLNDTYLFDGARWKKVSVQNPPPPRENGQLVYDERRGRTILIGGHEEEGSDSFAIYEFDGVDWVTRFAAGASELPRALRNRTDTSAFWHPLRRTVLFFGGNFKSLELCPISDEEVVEQISSDPGLESSLVEAGCLGGYAHDLWEWNGVVLTRLSDVSFSGYENETPVFSQVGDHSWISQPSTGAAEEEMSVGRRLLAQRFDSRDKHFLLRSSHERAFGQGDAVVVQASGVDSSGPEELGNDEFRSPIFSTGLRMEAAFDAGTGNVVLVHPADGRVFRTDGRSWSSLEESSPFSRGLNDFVASAWDSVNQRIVLFEPQRAHTWVYEEGGWTRVETGVVPPLFGAIPRNDDELPHYGPVSLSGGGSQEQEYLRTEVLLSVPKMAFDRSRSRAVMVYGEALWEFSGSQWETFSLPAALTECDVATLIAYDPARERTVATGCQAPAETWEWDGAGWHGPGPSPFIGRVQQWDGNTFGLAEPVIATVQLDWTHPDALFYSPSQSGVAMLDNDGHLRVWNGSSWQEGARLHGAGLGIQDQMGLTYPWMGDEKSYAHSENDSWNLYFPRMRPFGPRKVHPRGTSSVTINSYLPTVFYPPGYEDPNTHAITIFRDLGSNGMRELRPDDGYTQWHRAPKNEDAIYPFPQAMLGAEHIHVKSWSDPATATHAEDESPYPDAEDMHSKASNMLWPFRVFVDHETETVRMMTHRGEIWEIGAETVADVGDECAVAGDCLSGHCVDGFCCDSWCGQRCRTCAGATPGICSSVPAGEPDPRGTCGSGECAGVCSDRNDPLSGTRECEFTAGTPCGDGASCEDGVFTPAASCESYSLHGNGLGERAFGCVQPDPEDVAPCSGGFGCADDSSCQTSCSSRADCAGRFNECDGSTGSCVPDAVAVLAESMGVEASGLTSDLKPKSLEDVANELRELGFPEEDGVFTYPGSEIDDHSLQFDPTERRPFTGLNYCVNRILFCAEHGSTIDACVAGSERCTTATPWDGLDPAGVDCCPENCLLEYLEDRSAGESPSLAIAGFVKDGCYPGME